MNKMYKLFGAVAIVALFFIGTASTGLSAIKEEQTVGSEPSGGEEPLGIIIPADLVLTGISKQAGTQKLVLTVTNQGSGPVLVPIYAMHVWVAGIMNGPENFLALGLMLPGQSRTYTTRWFIGGTLPRQYQIVLDTTDVVNEGLFGGEDNTFNGFI